MDVVVYSGGCNVHLTIVVYGVWTSTFKIVKKVLTVDQHHMCNYFR